MKNNVTSKSAALLVAGLIQVSTAHAEGQSFTPIENLAPEQRQVLSEQLNDLTKNINIDWDETAVGVDENGQLILMPKSESGMRLLASPSSWGSIVNVENETK